MTNELVLIILGSNIEKYDGLVREGSFRNSHLHSIIDLVGQLKNEGFNIGYIDRSSAEEAAFSMIKNGHIVFFNIYNKIAFLKLPKQITQKQFITLKKFEEALNTFELMYEQSINPIDEEKISSKVYTRNYKVDPLKTIIK